MSPPKREHETVNENETAGTAKPKKARTPRPLPRLPPSLCAEIVADLPIHVLVQSILGNSFWTEEVLPRLPRMTVTRDHDLKGESSVLRTLRNNPRLTTLVIRKEEDDDEGLGPGTKAEFFQRIARIESIVHLWLIRVGCGPHLVWDISRTESYGERVSLRDCTRHLLSPMVPRLESLVLDGVRLRVGFVPRRDYEELRCTLQRSERLQRLEFRNDARAQNFEKQWTFRLGPTKNIEMVRCDM